MYNSMRAVQIFYAILICCGYTLPALSCHDIENDNAEQNRVKVPNIYCPYNFEQSVATTCNYQNYDHTSQSWGGYLLTNCRKGTPLSNCSFLVSYVGTMPAYPTNNIPKKMTYFVTGNDYKFYCFSCGKDQNYLLNKFVNYIHQQLQDSPDSFKLRYQIDDAFNRNSLHRAAQYTYSFRQKFISPNNQGIIGYPTDLKSSSKTRSVDDLAVFIQQNKCLYYIGNRIDNDDNKKFNEFWKSLDINTSSGKSDFAKDMPVIAIEQKFTEMKKKQREHAVILEHIIDKPAVIHTQRQNLLDKFFPNYAITPGRKALNAIDDLQAISMIDKKNVECTSKISAGMYQQWDGIICIACNNDQLLLNNIKAYQLKHPQGQVFWMAEKFENIPSTIITGNFHPIPGNPHKLLPKLYDMLAQFRTNANTLKTGH